MRILVTGATGFVGSRLLARLAEIRGHELYSMQRYVTGRNAAGAGREVKVVLCDLHDQSAVESAVQEIQPEVVCHLASISPVSYSYDHPNEVMDTNLSGTINLAESCRRAVPHFKHFLFASTSETFGNGPVPKREDTPQSPNSPYSVSKQAAEKYLLYMWEAYKFPVTVLRPFNTYGRRDNADFLVERMIVQMLQGGIVKLGDPTPERDLLYIDDHVDAYLACLDKPERSIGQAFNFCTGEKVTVRALAEKLRDMTGFRGQLVWNTIPRRPLDIQVMYGDPSKARSLLGWEPKTSLEQGLSSTIKFWRKKLAGSEQASRATT